MVIQLARQDDGKFLINDARITFRNFAGAAGQFNAAGQRNFHVVLPDDVAQDLKDEAFNVKSREPREEGSDWFHHLKVNVKTDSNIPPKVYIVTSKGRRKLDEDGLASLDWVDFAKIDLIFSRYKRDWPDGRTTVTAYLTTFFGTIREDELEQRYSDVPDLESAQGLQNWEQTSEDQIEREKFLEMENPF